MLMNQSPRGKVLIVTADAEAAGIAQTVLLRAGITVSCLLTSDVERMNREIKLGRPDCLLIDNDLRRTLPFDSGDYRHPDGHTIPVAVIGNPFDQRDQSRQSLFRIGRNRRPPARHDEMETETLGR